MGKEMEKTFSPSSELCSVGEGTEVSIGGADGASWGLVVEQVRQEGFELDENECELNSLRNRLPVEVLKERGDVVPVMDMGQETGSIIMN